MRDDIRVGLRALGRTPGFTCLAIGSLALGIGACTVVFSLVNAVYFRPLPFQPAARLAVIQLFDQRTNCKGACAGGLTNRELDDWRRSLGTIDALGAIGLDPAVVSDRVGTAVGEGAVVSANFLSLLGVRPSLGRLFDANDDREGANNVVVLSDAFWHSRYGGDSAIVGGTVALDGVLFQIVGILPPSAAVGRPLFTADTATAQFFVPLTPSTAREPDGLHSYTLLARLRPGAQLETLRAQIAVLLTRAGAEGGAPNSAASAAFRRTALVQPLREAHARAVAASSAYALFLTVVAFVLLIVSVNLAGLFLARFDSRRHEVLVRSVLGATPWTLARQFSTEGLLCAAAGGVVGVVLAERALRFAKFLPLYGIPYWTSFILDGRVIAFAACLVAVSAALVGLAPALVVLPRDTDLSLRSMSAALTVGRGIWRHRLVVITLEIQVALMLLTVAGLLGKTFVDAATRDLGMAKRSVLMVTVAANRGTQPMSPAQREDLAARLLERLQSLPGTVSAAIHASGPEFVGLKTAGNNQMIAVDLPMSSDIVTPEFFRTWSIPVIRGRAFAARDAADAPPVVVLDDATAQRLFPDGHALGRRIAVQVPTSATIWLTVVGIAGTTRRSLFRGDSERFYPTLYQPLAQSPLTASQVSFVMRTRGPAEDLIPSVRAAIHEIAPDAPLIRLSSFERQVEQRLAPARLNVIVLGSFAVVALIIAALGIYGTVTQFATKRAAEVGLRMALGAQAGNVLWLMMRSTVIATLVGIAGGLAGSLALARVVRALLYGEAAADPRVFVSAALVLATTAAVAAYFPARHATHVDPSAALRAS